MKIFTTVAENISLEKCKALKSYNKIMLAAYLYRLDYARLADEIMDGYPLFNMLATACDSNTQETTKNLLFGR